jgi:hypothetical protein
LDSGDILFNENCLEMIFFEILLKLDFSQSDEGGLNGECAISSKMYQCFERFFIYINELYGQLVVSINSLRKITDQTPDITSPIITFEVFDD